MANPFTGRSDQGFAENLAQLDALGLLANTWEAARDEYLGIDDFRRMLQKGSEGDVKGAVKSGLTGALELGTSLIPGIGAAKVASVAAKAPKSAKLLKFMGAGAKTPLRGVAQNVAVPLALMGGLSAAAPTAGRLLSRFRGPVAQVAEQAPTPLYDPYAGVNAVIGSPATADNEALIRLMMQQGII